MKRPALVLSIVMMLAGCATVPIRSIDRVHAGMDREQVRSIMGQPDTVAKDFWSRVPWNMTDRYYVCYSDGKVDTFGQAT